MRTKEAREEACGNVGYTDEGRRKVGIDKGKMMLSHLIPLPIIVSSPLSSFPFLYCFLLSVLPFSPILVTSPLSPFPFISYHFLSFLVSSPFSPILITSPVPSFPFLSCCFLASPPLLPSVSSLRASSPLISFPSFLSHPNFLPSSHFLNCNQIFFNISYFM